MKSYSKVFKASQVYMTEEVKVISQPVLKLHALNGHHEPSQDMGIKSDTAIAPVITDAMAEAEAIIESAENEALRFRENAALEIDQWWAESRQQLELMAEEAKQQGYHEGFLLGKQEAKIELQQEYEAKFTQVQRLLEQAYAEKEAIIAEAEPFLLELSTAIASQIIKQELSTEPDKLVELIKQHILRFKEKEFITVCVHPDDFEFIQSQRAHLVAVVNGETEIKIIPDHSVTEKGCVIRTAYGSVDARIDTQIEEIKRVILEAGRES